MGDDSNGNSVAYREGARRAFKGALEMGNPSAFRQARDQATAALLAILKDEGASAGFVVTFLDDRPGISVTLKSEGRPKSAVYAKVTESGDVEISTAASSTSVSLGLRYNPVTERIEAKTDSDGANDAPPKNAAEIVADAIVAALRDPVGPG